MGPFDQLLRLHLEAAAYLTEIVIAEVLFLGPFEKRARFPLRFAGAFLFLLALAFGTGLPQGSSMTRFLWFACLMLLSILAALFCYRGEPLSLTSACMAGVATQHIANKFTLLCKLTPGVGALIDRFPWWDLVLEVLVFAAVYGVVYSFFGRRLRHSGTNPQLNALSVVIVLICVGVNRLIVDNAMGNLYYEIAACIYAILCCVFALIIQFNIARWEEEKREGLILKRLLSDSEKQYEQWKANVDLVNLRFHDIKHMLDRIQRLSEQNAVTTPDISQVRKAIDDFSPVIRTGNEVLDILLRNMSDLCAQNNIQLNCVAYTDHLKHFDGMSLYFLFANALDNAMESAAKVTEADKRLIDVSIKQFGNSVSIHFWNYFKGPVSFEGALPISADSSGEHGYGMKSIQMIVDKFGGAMSAHVDGEVFNLDIILPAEGEPM